MGNTTKRHGFSLLLLLCFWLGAAAQDSIVAPAEAIEQPVALSPKTVVRDSLPDWRSPYTNSDSIMRRRRMERVRDSLQNAESTVPPVAITVDTGAPFQPSPKKSVIYSAIFPGLGQIYNRRYWKLPLVYGGFLGFMYAVTWNGRYYDDYSDAYVAIRADNPLQKSNVAIWGPFTGRKTEDLLAISDTEIARLQTAFKSKKDYYRRNRDMCILLTVAWYAIGIIDAYVDAQLYDFDMSPDLSLKIQPSIFQDPTAGGGSTSLALGLRCVATF